MARQKPIDLSIVQAWLAAWNESDVFSDDAVRQLLALITDPWCLVVVTLGVGREPRSLVFGRRKLMIPAPISGFAKKERVKFAKKERVDSSTFVSRVAPVAPSVGQLWHQTGVKSETIPKLERILRWDGEDWVVFGLVYDSPGIIKQGKQACDFNEALACAHEHTKWFDCEFIYTYDGSTWGNA